MRVGRIILVDKNHHAIPKSRFLAALHIKRINEIMNLFRLIVDIVIQLMKMKNSGGSKSDKQSSQDKKIKQARIFHN